MTEPIDILIEILKGGGTDTCCPPDGYHDNCNLWELNGTICHDCWYDYAEMMAERENVREQKRVEKLTRLRIKGVAYYEDKLERRRWYRVRLKGSSHEMQR